MLFVLLFVLLVLEFGFELLFELLFELELLDELLELELLDELLLQLLPFHELHHHELFEVSFFFRCAEIITSSAGIVLGGCDHQLKVYHAFERLK